MSVYAPKTSLHHYGRWYLTANLLLLLRFKNLLLVDLPLTAAITKLVSHFLFFRLFLLFLFLMGNSLLLHLLVTIRLRDEQYKVGCTHLHMPNVIYARFIEMPYDIVRQADDRILHPFGHLPRSNQKRNRFEAGCEQTLPNPSVSACF